ncbi:unnamed protein product, partial [marine sediment metagenome]
FVRKDRIPSPKLFAEINWKYKKEYIYKANTWSRIHPDEPLTERLVTLTHDKPLSSKEVEAEITQRWIRDEKYEPYKLDGILFCLYIKHGTPVT